MLKVRYQGGDDNQEALVTSQRILESLVVGAQKMRAWALDSPKALRFWPGACRSHSTWGPSRCHVSVVGVVESSSCQVQSSSVTWIWMNKHVEEAPCQWEGSFFWAIILSSVKGPSMNEHTLVDGDSRVWVISKPNNLDLFRCKVNISMF